MMNHMNHPASHDYSVVLGLQHQQPLGACWKQALSAHTARGVRIAPIFTKRQLIGLYLKV